MIFTIGYSNKSIQVFIEKLLENKIDLVVDVRSKPYSRNPQFNKDNFKEYLNNNNIEYLFKGNCLGGLGINYNFNESIKKVIKLSKKQNLALVCVEKNPKNCHRYQILTPEIEKNGYEVSHIL